MTTTLDRRLQSRMQQIQARGGLPFLADLEEVRRHLNELANILDEYAADAAAVVDAYGEEVHIPFKIETENLAVLGLVGPLVREAMEEEFKPFIERIERHLTLLESARRRQEGHDAS